MKPLAAIGLGTLCMATPFTFFTLGLIWSPSIVANIFLGIAAVFPLTGLGASFAVIMGWLK